MPSPHVLLAAAGVLGVPLQVLLEAAGSPAPSSVHTLVYQIGDRHRSALPVARRLFADRVDLWVEVVDPRRRTASAPQSDVLAVRGPLRLAAHSFRASDPIDAVCRVLRDGEVRDARVGIVFGASSAVLRAAPDVTPLLDSETTWEQEVGRTVGAVVGLEPVANVCVYRQADVEESGRRIDPLAAALSLLNSHPHVVTQDRGDEIVSGLVAIEQVLLAARPPGVGADTWHSLARAAAAGLGRRSQ